MVSICCLIHLYLPLMGSQELVITVLCKLLVKRYFFVSDPDVGWDNFSLVFKAVTLVCAVGIFSQSYLKYNKTQIFMDFLH